MQYTKDPTWKNCWMQNKLSHISQAWIYKELAGMLQKKKKILKRYINFISKMKRLEHYIGKKAILEQHCQNYTEYTNIYCCFEKNM